MAFPPLGKQDISPRDLKYLPELFLQESCQRWEAQTEQSPALPASVPQEPADLTYTTSKTSSQTTQPALISALPLCPECVLSGGHSHPFGVPIPGNVGQLRNSERERRKKPFLLVVEKGRWCGPSVEKPGMCWGKFLSSLVLQPFSPKWTHRGIYQL